MANSQGGFGVTLTGFANPQAYANYAWPIFVSSTNNPWNMNPMWYSYRNWAGG